MATYNDGDNPAFPVAGFTDPNGNVHYPDGGLTKREVYAMAALIGIIASDTEEWNVLKSPTDAADSAFILADAMLKASTK